MNDRGRIFKGIGGFYYVKTAAGVIECRARGRFRRDKITPLVGDEAEIELLGGDKGYLTDILPRRNVFTRPPVANIDTLAVIASAAPPVTDTLLIDRLTVTAEAKGIRPVVIINKCDIDRGDMLYDAYHKAGIACARVSAVTGEGMDGLLALLSSGVAAFSGNSGVGKSSILNFLDSRFSAEVGGLIERIGRGRHTTRHVELFELKNGLVIADTPGFSVFETDEPIMKEQLEQLFPEFSPYLGKCRFYGCAHGKDKGCAVREAVQRGDISDSRYQNYLRLYDEAKQLKAWELKTTP